MFCATAANSLEYCEAGINLVCLGLARTICYSVLIRTANLVLQSTVERIFVPPGPNNPRGLYADVPQGIFLVRGENVMLLGEIDLDKDDEPPAGYDQADAALVKSLAKRRHQDEKTKDKAKIKKLSALGFEGENLGETLL